MEIIVENISIILMGVAIFFYPIWVILSHIFDGMECSIIYPRKRDRVISVIIGVLGIVTLCSLALSVIFSLAA